MMDAEGFAPTTDFSGVSVDAIQARLSIFNSFAWIQKKFKPRHNFLRLPNWALPIPTEL